MQSGQGVLWTLVLSLVLAGAWAEPNITSPAETKVDFEHNATAHTVTFLCRVEGLEGNTVLWKSVDHDIVISENTTIMNNDDVKYSIINTDSEKQFDLMLIGIEDSDQGFYECSIMDTDQSIIVHLDLANVPEILDTDLPNVNKTECCIANGVSENCLPGCVPDDVDLDVFDAFGECGSLQNLLGILTCFTGETNHDACCWAEKHVTPLCITFCRQPALTQETLVAASQCTDYDNLDDIFDCFRRGDVHLPGRPRQVKGISRYSLEKDSYSIIVSWSEPSKNPENVTHYYIKYKTPEDTNFKSFKVPKTERKYTLEDKIRPETNYHIEVVAAALNGASEPSSTITIYVLPKTNITGQEADINECCASKNIPDNCKAKLCTSKTWSQFSSLELLACSAYMDDLFSCLTGEQDHTPCCSSYGVDGLCQPICSGHPPMFDNSLITCLFDMDVIEACVQEGYGKNPVPPTSVYLVDASSNAAVVGFDPSKTPAVTGYRVQLSTGPESMDFVDKLQLAPSATRFSLAPLQPNTYYNVRVITETANGTSLPSETVSFLTDIVKTPTEAPVINRPVDLMGCCRDRGMPQLCWENCIYRANITAYYYPILDTCRDHIADVLTCAADGRNHVPCCRRRNIKEVCETLCEMTSSGQLSPYVAENCVSDTPTAVACYMEGITTLPRHPDVKVTNVTSGTIRLEWEHPETSSLIEKYIVHWAQKGMNTTMDRTNNTYYILNDLRSGAAYEISVSSENEEGTSVPSPVLTAFTYTDFVVPSANTSQKTGRPFWQDIVHCCKENVKDPDCQDICMDSVNTGVVTETDKCLQDYPKLLSCYNDGQDHSLCCQKANLPEECLPLCKGHSLDQNHVTDSCVSLFHRNTIYGCALENRDLVPGTPRNFIVKQAQVSGSVEMSWESPQSCTTDCSYSTHYWMRNQPDKVMNMDKVVSPATLTGLELNQWWTFTLVATNNYGSGAAAPWVTIFVPNLERSVEVRLVNNQPYLEKGSDAYISCRVIGFSEDYPPTLQWFFNGDRPLIGQTSQDLYKTALDPAVDEGYYTCTAKDNFTTSSDSIYLPLQYPPDMEKLDDSAGGLGETSTITCIFKGYPDSSKNLWMFNGQPLYNASSPSLKYGFTRHVVTNPTRIKYELLIANTQQADYGTYSIDVYNTVGNSSCSTLLKDPLESMEPPARRVSNSTECCMEKGVTGVCLELCTWDIDIDAAIANPAFEVCPQYLVPYLLCGTDGRDHSKCCHDEGVYPHCYPFCKGNSPPGILDPANTVQLLQCAADAEKLFKCVQEGLRFLPYPPVNVQLTEGDEPGTLTVRWDPPEFNRDYVHHYTVFISTNDPNVPAEQHSTNEHMFEYNITNVVSGADYTVYVVAGNENGTSLPSNTASILQAQHGDDDDDDDDVALIVGVTIAVVVVLAIIGIVAFVVLKARAGSPKNTSEAVTFENPGFGSSNQDSVKIQGVDEGFDYGRLQEQPETSAGPYDQPTAGGSAAAEESSSRL